MTKKEFVKSERQFMVDILKKLTPEQWKAKTLCEGWSVEDLAAHTVSRERNIIGGIGLVVPGLHRLHDKRIERVSARGHQYILEKLSKYPSHMPASLNTAEFWVHNEDILRGELNMDRPAPNKAVNVVLWSSLKGLVKVKKSLVVDIGNADLVNSETNEHIRIRFDKKPKITTITGTAGELLLFFYGRRKAAKVSID